MVSSWEEARLGNYLKLRGGFAFKSKDFTEDGEIPVLRISNIKPNGKISLEDAVYVSREIANQNKTYLLKPGNIVIAMSGATTGKTAVVEQDFPILLNQRVGLFHIYDSNILDEDYLQFVVQSQVFKNSIGINAIGGAQPNISGKQIEEIVCGIPPFAEQKKISDILTSVDNAISQTEAIIEQTEKVKKGLMQELFTKGIGNTNFKQTEIGEIPEEWEVKTLEEITMNKVGMKRGPFGGALKKEIFVEEGYAVYEQQHVISNDLSNVRYFIDETKYQELITFEVKPGDILISCSGTVGRVALVPQNVKKGVINQALLRLRFNLEICNNYFMEYLLNWDRMQERITDMSHGSTLKNIVAMKILRNTLIPIPTVNEQKKINRILKSIETKYQVEVSKLEQLKIIRKGLMQNLLTGKVRVKVDGQEAVNT